MSSRASTAAGRRRASARTGGSRPRPAAHKAPKRARPQPRRAAQRSARPKPRARRPVAQSRRRGNRFAFLGRPVVLAALAVLVAGLAAAYLFWARDLPLFAVERVNVQGVSGPEAGAATAALEEAAREMTTLHVDQERLAEAVAGLRTVRGVSATSDFPHGLTIEVRERPPVLLAKSGERVEPVAGDGRILAGVDVADEKLPVVTVEELPARGRVDGEALEMALVAGGAPAPLRELIRRISVGGDEGVEVVLKGSLPIRFGDGARAEEKWAAAAAVLASPQVEALDYLDVRVPERPALGGAAPPAEPGEELVPAP